jgi:prepilin-type N-terminal cleavage/methylation domain-containing protein/prepilin-type processing-associated H-X9-DG protein
MRNHSKHPNAGFTLVELLVVIVIIATLAALSMLGFSRLRKSANAAITVANIRQLQNANISYSTDHNGRYVTYSYTAPDGQGTSWLNNLEFLAYLTGNKDLADKTLAEVDQNTVVPESLLDPTTVRARQRMSTRLAASFGMNHEFIKTTFYADGSKERFISASKLTDSSRTAAFVTTTDSAVKYAGRKLWWNSPVEGKTTDGKMAFRHNDKAIVSYFDGSSGMITRQDIDRFDAAGGNANPFWNGTY